MTTSGPSSPTPHGSIAFDRLWAACLDCGLLEPTSSCTGCGVPGRPAPRGGGQAGSRLWFRQPGGDGRAPSLRGATLVESGGRWLTTIHDDGETRVDEDGTEHAWWSPPARDSTAEQLLVAAIHWRLPEVAARAVRSRARQQLDDTDRAQVLRFAAVAAANDHPELLDGLELRPATRTWFEVLALARAGNHVAACRQALLLGGVVFPARLGLWARAAGQLPDELRTAILARLADFRGNVEVDAAVAATRQALTGGTSSPPPSRLGAATADPPLPTTVDELCAALRNEDHEGWFANLGAALSDRPHDEAVDRLAELSTEAASAARRVACANLALDLIEAAAGGGTQAATQTAPPTASRAAATSSATTSSAATSNGVPGPLPTRLPDALRELLAGPIDDASFRRFAALLAEHDAEWMAEFDQRADLPHATSVPARFFAARARGLPAAIAVASGLLASFSVDDDRPWLRVELDRLRTDVLAAMPTDPAVRQAIAQHPQVATTTASSSHDPTELALIVEQWLTAAGPQPDPSMTELLTSAAHQLGHLNAADRERLAPMVSTRLRALAHAVLDASARQLDDLEQTWQTLHSPSPEATQRPERSTRAARRSQEQARDEAILDLEVALRRFRSPLVELRRHAPPDLQDAFAALLQRAQQLEVTVSEHAQISRQRHTRQAQRRARGQPPERR